MKMNFSKRMKSSEVQMMELTIHLEIQTMHNCDNARTLVRLAFAVYVIGYLYFTIFSRDVGSIAFVDLRPFKTYSRLLEIASTPIIIVTGFMADFLQ